MKEELKELYEKIPSFTCKENCGLCCGPILCKRPESEILNKQPKVKNQEVLDCPFLDENKRCSCYEVRPLVCRLFGAIEILKCPEGCKPDCFLTEDDVQSILAVYKKLGDDFLISNLGTF